MGSIVVMYQFKYNGGYPEKPDSLSATLREHLEWLLVRNYSPSTVHNRERNVGRFIDWCTDRHLIKPQEISKPIIERYQKALFYYRKKDGQPLHFGSQQRTLCHLKMYFKWLSQYNVILFSPAADLVLPRDKQQLPKDILSPRETERLLAQPDVTTPVGLRDRAILETLYSSGIRRAELVQLKLHHVDFESGTLMVRQGKGQKDRLVPLGERACFWIERYLLEARPLYAINPDEHDLFLSRLGGKMALTSLSIRVKSYFRGAKINKVGACHLLRHAMATHMLDNGADTRYIQAMLGHAQLSTTQIYTHVAIKKLKAVHSATHPAKLPSKE